MKLVAAIELREKENLTNISKKLPGYYKWWASEKELKTLLNSKYIDNKYFKALLPFLTKKEIKGKTYYYIYVGVAINESIRERLDWHINQHHTKTSVESGFLSTLRQTLSSLVAGNQYDEKNTNEFIDKLLVEYAEVDLEIHSKEAKEKIEKIEKDEINNNVLPLNIKDNKNEMLTNYLKELRSARKNAREIIWKLETK